MSKLPRRSQFTHTLVHWLSSPNFPEDDDKTRVAYRLNTISLVGIVLTFVYAGVWLVVLPDQLARLIFVPPILLLFALTIALIRLRRVTAASWLMLAGSWALITLITATAGGTRSPFFGFYVLIVITAVIFSSWGAAVFFGILTLVTGLIMALLADTDLIAEPIATPWSAWLTQASIMIFVAADAYIIVRDMGRSLHRAQRALSEREKSDMALRQSEERFKALVANSTDIITVVQADGMISFESQSVQHILGHDPDERVGKNAFDYIHPDDLEPILTLFAEKAGVMGAEAAMEYRIRHADGTWVYMESRARNRLDDPAIQGIVINSREVTERKQAEHEAIERQKHTLRFQEQLETLHTISATLDATDSLNEFCRLTVELGREWLGFDRVGLWLYDRETDQAHGTYGTDEHGRTLDEHHLHFAIDVFPGDSVIVSGEKHLVLHDPFTIKTVSDEPLAEGWLAQAALWNGERVIGHLSVDNLLNHRPVETYQMEILSIYATAVANLYTRKQSEIALRESETRYRNLFENAPMSIVLSRPDKHVVEFDEAHDPVLRFKNVSEIRDSNVVMVNAAFEKLLGYAQDEAEPLDPYDTYPNPKDRDRMLARLVQDGQVKDYEVQRRRRDGSIYFSSVTIAPFITGGEVMLLTMEIDITERKTAENALRLTQHTVDKSRIPILWVAPDSSVMYANEAQCNILGYTREELTAMRVSDFDPDWTPEFWFSEGWNRIKSEGQWTFETRNRRKDGTIFPAEVTATYGEFEGQEYVFAFTSDITDRKRLEGEAREAEILRGALAKEKELVALKDRFISMVSHEFRTPLAVIKTSSDLLSRYFDRLDEARRGQKLAQIEEQITHLTRMVDKTLALSRSQAGKVDFNPAPLDLEPFCRNIFEQVQFTDTADHRFEFISNAPDRPVRMDGNLLQHILTNLLTNAIKYSPEDSRIAFELNHDDAQITIAVRDEGIGIPEDDLARLFDPFHRASNVGKADGTGLGLSIVKEYVELHGGRIEVESEIGKGSLFRILLPME